MPYSTRLDWCDAAGEDAQKKGVLLAFLLPAKCQESLELIATYIYIKKKKEREEEMKELLLFRKQLESFEAAQKHKLPFLKKIFACVGTNAQGFPL